MVTGGPVDVVTGDYLAVAHVEGDDLSERLPELLAAGHDLAHLDTGAPLRSWGHEPLTANAYLGGFGIAAALDAGADVVVTGRVADASLASGAAAWWWGWTPCRHHRPPSWPSPAWAAGATPPPWCSPASTWTPRPHWPRRPCERGWTASPASRTCASTGSASSPWTPRTSWPGPACCGCRSTATRPAPAARSAPRWWSWRSPTTRACTAWGRPGPARPPAPTGRRWSRRRSSSTPSCTPTAVANRSRPRR